ncbi:sugar ABC transporter ATP-binding protein [Siculibacillus lacustris]|uniref:Sugar ABC transporter ATP-binding protein n=1 Tax=Siculibacillus lacustris TaxID=1549641 RepID=A0A4Q9VWQ3_9HYPH|nr:sugar ABC transporter ATP-binding protein [Siculibacillus lacustris]TBW40304.1 sugar ABC transporter ATP-binding protein [Siculibacillus lacustris]
MTALIEVRNLDKSFPGVKALRSASFTLEAGEVHALMGENGAGKSTLMKMLAGIYSWDSGEVLVDGAPVTIAGPKAAQALGIGIIHQELNLMNHLTAAQNIFIGREPRRRFGFLDEGKLNFDAAALFRRMNVTIDPKTLVGDLTVAKQQIVEIAKALSFHSRVLIMDEPTAALNTAEIDDLFVIIRDLKAHGVGIVYISHKMDELKRIADRVTVMRDGETIATLPAQSTPVETIISLMVGRELAHAEPPKVPEIQGDEALRVVGLSRGRALRDISFSVRRGEILGFAGLMGAGRTEVARAVFGADPIDTGEIWVRGAKLKIHSPADAVRAGIAYLSEDRKRFGLVTAMDVEANISLASVMRHRRAWGFLDFPSLKALAARYVKSLTIKTPSTAQVAKLLSGGNQQKLVIAKWLARDSDILFFDEPTRGIDVGAKAEIYKLLQSLADQGRAIIMISSELPEILRMSHRILVMCEGRISGELTAAEATQETIMKLATRTHVATGTARGGAHGDEHGPVANE